MVRCASCISEAISSFSAFQVFLVDATLHPAFKECEGATTLPPVQAG
jgi:hypothetical protein